MWAHSTWLWIRMYDRIAILLLSLVLKKGRSSVYLVLFNGVWLISWTYHMRFFEEFIWVFIFHTSKLSEKIYQPTFKLKILGFREGNAKSLLSNLLCSPLLEIFLFAFSITHGWFIRIRFWRVYSLQFDWWWWRVGFVWAFRKLIWWCFWKKWKANFWFVPQGLDYLYVNICS